MRWPWQSRTPIPPPCQAYLDQVKARTWPRSMPIAELPIVVLDAETTGMDPGTDRLISLSAVLIQGQDILLAHSFDALVRAEYGPSGRASVEVHGILQSESTGGEAETEALFRFLNYIGGHWLAGHFVGHDLAILNAILKRVGCPPLANPVLDTATLYHRWKHGPLPTDVPGRTSISLDQLCQELNVPIQDRHTAAGDTLMTAMVLIRLLKKLEKRGILRVKDL